MLWLVSIGSELKHSGTENPVAFQKVKINNSQPET